MIIRHSQASVNYFFLALELPTLVCFKIKEATLGLLNAVLGLEGEATGAFKAKVEDLRHAMSKLGYTAEQALDFYDIPEEDYPKYLPMLT